MFGDDAAASAGRYRTRIVAGHLRQHKHEEAVQHALDEGSAAGWRLVSATTTNGTGTYVTGIFWDTAPER
jgi:hypothetical protein